MSVRLLRHPTRRVAPKYTDALESFWHTLLYIILRHCDHDYNSQKIVSTLKGLGEYTFEHGRMVGGAHKEDELETQWHIMMMRIGSPPLRYVLKKSAIVLAARYNDHEDLDTLGILNSPEWMENAFDGVLNDPNWDWDIGKGNVQRDLSHQ